MSRHSTEMAALCMTELAIGSRALPPPLDYEEIVVEGDEEPNHLYGRLVGVLCAVSADREILLRAVLDAIDVSPAEIAAGDAIAIEPELRAIVDSGGAASERASVRAELDRLMESLKSAGLSSTV